MSPSPKRRSKQKRSALPLIFVGVGLIVISIAVVILSTRDAPGSDPGKTATPVPAIVDYPAPAVALSDLSGGSVSLDDHRGRVVLVNNWATWCPPCRAEMPALQAYAQAHRDDAFVLIGINAGDTAEQVMDFVEEYQLTFSMWLDPSSEALRAFQNNALPSSYVIDKTGKVRLIWMGAVTLDALEAYVTPLLAE